MNHEEILAAAKEAGCHFPLRSGFGDCRVPQFFGIDGLERFAKIIERKTIERCAVVAEELRHPDGFSGENVDWCAGTDHAAAAIRKLGEQE